MATRSALKSITKIATLIFLVIFATKIIEASHCPASDYDCQITELQGEIDSLSPAHENNKKDLADLRSQITNIENRIDSLAIELLGLEADIRAREEDLAFAQSIFREKTNSHYKFIRLYDPLMPFLASADASEAFREINLRQKAADEDRKTMEIYGEELLLFKKDKESLEQNRINLASAQTNLDSQADFLSGEVEKVESYIADLSSKQQELAALKAGGFQTSIGDTPPTLEPCSGPPENLSSFVLMQD